VLTWPSHVGANHGDVKMSEEQPTFKVKDRRLFNPDGTPREVERDEATESNSSSDSVSAASSSAIESNAAKTPPASASGADAAAAAPAVERAAGGEAQSTAASAQDGGRAASPESAQEEEEDLYAGEEVPGADDPASFINFLMSIASNAAASLGMMEHPVTGQRGVDLPLAKLWIDVLGMLQQKTRGNLAPQEQQIFEGLLADLRMQYYSLTSAAPPAASRGFTGRDIIGGK
jgi:hypothetical protein